MLKYLIAAVLLVGAVAVATQACADPTPIIVDGLCVDPLSGYVYGPPPCEQYSR